MTNFRQAMVASWVLLAAPALADATTVAIDSGSNEPDGLFWDGDGASDPHPTLTGSSLVKATTTAISNTDEDAVYRTYRYGRDFSYNVPVPNGTYDVEFMFMEPWATARGMRVFDINLEGREVEDGIDLFARAGRFRAYDLVKRVTVSDGRLNIRLETTGSSDRNNAIVSGIIVKPVTTTEPTPTPPPTEPAPPTGDVLPPAPAGKKWALTWSEEFNGTTIDTSKWTVRTSSTDVRNWVPSHVYLNGQGQAVIKATCTNGRFTSASIDTSGKYSFKGTTYVATRFRLAKHSGWRPAIWTQSPTTYNVGNGSVDGAELDIMEQFDRSGGVSSNIHWDGYESGHRTVGINPLAKLDLVNFHTVGMQVGPTDYRFFANGALKWTTTAAGITTGSNYFRLTGEKQSAFSSTNCQTLVQNGSDSMLVDYIRVYQLVNAS